jgi:hypothetical protein
MEIPTKAAKQAGKRNTHVSIFGSDHEGSVKRRVDLIRNLNPAKVTGPTETWAIRLFLRSRRRHDFVRPDQVVTVPSEIGVISGGLNLRYVRDAVVPYGGEDQGASLGDFDIVGVDELTVLARIILPDKKLVLGVECYRH